MSILYGPKKTGRLRAVLFILILGAPLVVAGSFVWRLFRGDFPSDADTVAIPIFGYSFFIFPFALLLLVVGLRRYREGMFVLCWNTQNHLVSLLWSLIALFPVGYVSLAMVMDGLQSRLYWVSVFFIAHLYGVLLLRAAVLQSSRSGDATDA
jgi:hypothetical protein